MKSGEATWQEIRAFAKTALVTIPTGSLEQHGPHLPLITDSLIVTAVAEGIESRFSEGMILLPTVWMGASSHHLTYAGSVTATTSTYLGALRDLISCYQGHGFYKFLLLNGHGGNVDLNQIALRDAKQQSPDHVFAQFSYYDLIERDTAQILSGPTKHMGHACEAETSLILHLAPHLVRKDKVRDDGMKSDPPIEGLVLNFDELSEEGSVGFATLGTAEKGRQLFEAAVDACSIQTERLINGFVMTTIQE